MTTWRDVFPDFEIGDEALEAAGKAVEEYTGRVLLAEGVSEMHAGDGRHHVMLQHHPSRDVVATVGGNPVDISHSPSMSTVSRIDGDPWTGNVVVSYTAGYGPEDMPSEIKSAVVDVAKSGYMTDKAKMLVAGRVRHTEKGAE